MKILIVQPAAGNIRNLIKPVKEEFQKLDNNMIVEIWDSKNKDITYVDIVKAETDLFVNFNLSGFEQGTLTGGIAYNLLNCKQIHILSKDKLPNEKYLANQLSISMFFYCIGSEYYQYLLGRYPDIPYLKEISNWNNENTEKSIMENSHILCSVVQETAKICHLS